MVKFEKYQGLGNDFIIVNEKELIEKSKRELSHLEAILGAPETIDSLCRDIIKHYEEQQKILKQKQIVKVLKPQNEQNLGVQEN